MRKDFGKIVTAVLIGSMLMISGCAGKAEASGDTPVSVTTASTVTEHRTEEIKETKKETSESTVSATDVSENVIETAEISGNDLEAAVSVSENDALETATEEETEKVKSGETADSDKSSAKSTTSAGNSTETSTAKGNAGNNAGDNSSGSKGSNSASSTSTPASEPAPAPAPEPAPAPGPQVCQHTNTEDRIVGNTGRPIGNGQGCGQNGDLYHTFCKDCGADLGNERTVWGAEDHAYYTVEVYDTPDGRPLYHGTGSYTGHSHHVCYCGKNSYDDNYSTFANDHDCVPIQYYDADGNIWETKRCRYCPVEDGSDHMVQQGSWD